MRYVLKYPIMRIVQQTGYSKRMIQYKLNDIVKKLDDGCILQRKKWDDITNVTIENVQA